MKIFLLQTHRMFLIYHWQYTYSHMSDLNYRPKVSLLLTSGKIMQLQREKSLQIGIYGYNEYQ